MAKSVPIAARIDADLEAAKQELEGARAKPMPTERERAATSDVRNGRGQSQISRPRRRAFSTCASRAGTMVELAMPHYELTPVKKADE